MKKKTLFALATLLFVLGSAAASSVAYTGSDDPPPVCNPLTDPNCH